MSGGPAVFICTDRSGGVHVDRTGCPAAATHQLHPAGYVQHSLWAERSLTVATQATCEGCGRWEIWLPKRPDLRLARFSAERRYVTCDWGDCDAEAVAERHDPERQEWSPVCAEHTGLEPEREETP